MNDKTRKMLNEVIDAVMQDKPIDRRQQVISTLYLIRPVVRKTYDKRLDKDIEAAIEMLQTDNAMTNFERWKQELTIEKLMCNGALGLMCATCPATEGCKHTIGMCAKTFREWGNQKCK